ncbi:MAG TPA: hydrogenase nickel incorporation protein HypB [Rhodocyclaceae bacterium]|nr:hydrogenase nickel incorporation protein HypB [Rhodocyclaceae bacterium]HRQ45518.1 hydrogenase nickel incorporation protein HypB [Rhodocyclaceae bacterium]
MCTVCGCGSGEVKIGGMMPGKPVRPKPGLTRAWKPVASHQHEHVHTDGTHRTTHSQAHLHGHEGDLQTHLAMNTDRMDFGTGPAHAHVPGLSQTQMIRIERDILGKNDALAAVNRRALEARGIFALNLVSSPGSGKTTLLVRTIRELADSVPVAVIEGDQQTECDSERIRETGAPALQINTGKGCHLDADMVGRGLSKLVPVDDSLLFIENVGNLVCPAAFDLGEAHKVAILSVTEGEDKPLKYPDMFAAADLMLLNKIDLLPYVSFDIERAVEYAHRVNPRLTVMRVSATTGEGFDAWLAWIRQGLATMRRLKAGSPP